MTRNSFGSVLIIPVMVVLLSCGDEAPPGGGLDAAVFPGETFDFVYTHSAAAFAR